MEDLEEERSAHQTIADAYASLIVNKVMRPDTGTKKKQRSRFNERMFGKAVMERYNASFEEDASAWCHVLGCWCPKSNVIAMRLVPESLESSELAYILGVGEIPKMDPRNGEFHSILRKL